MTTVFFVRHAEPIHSWVDDRTRPLTDGGSADADRLIDFFRDKPVDAFVSSPYKRSFDTILPTARLFGRDIELDERLRERKAGRTGNNRELFRRRWEDKKFAEEDGECIESVQVRNIAALAEILRSKKDQTIVVGTHGTALSSILNYYNPKFGCDDFLRIINFMPYIVEMAFSGNALVSTEERLIVDKPFNP